MNNRKQTTHIRTYPEDKDKLDNLARELSIVQRSNVKIPEALRRITNVPGLKELLIKDAEAKRRLKI